MIKGGKVAVIGSLSDIEAIVQGKAGTRISTEKPGITYLLITSGQANGQPFFSL